MELWSRLIPEDDDIQGALYLAKTVCARTQSEIEKEIGEIRAVMNRIRSHAELDTWSEPYVHCAAA